MLAGLLANILSRFKVELAVTSLISLAIVGFGLLANAVTSPKVLFAFQVIAQWEAVFTKQALISTAIAAIFSAGTAWIARRAKKKSDAENEIRKAASEKNAADLKRIIDFEKMEKERLAADQVDLRGRVAGAENLLRSVSEKLTLMTQQTTPLIEAATIQMIKALTHPSPEFKKSDALLAKVQEDKIITPELTAMLKERETSTHPEVTEKEKLAAAALPILLKLAVIEKSTMDEVTTTTQLVTTQDEPAAKVEKEKEEAAK